MRGKGGGAIRRIWVLLLAMALLLGGAATATAAEIDWSGVKKPAAEDVAKSGLRYLKIGMIAGEPAGSTGAFTMTIDDSCRYFEDIIVGNQVKLSDQGERFYIFYAASGESRDYGYIATKHEIAQWDVGVILKSGDTALVREISIGYEDLTLKNGDILRNAAYVDVELVPWLDATGKKAFALEFQLTTSGKSLSSTDFKVSGVYANGAQEVWREDDWINLTNPSARVVEAKDSISAVTVELDYDVSIDTRLFRGRKYYGRVSDDPTEMDIMLMERYGFMEVISLYTIGLATDGNRVELAYRPEGWHAYGVQNEGAYNDADAAQLVYLGTADKKLPYMTKYFLSPERIELNYGLPAEPERLPERLPEKAAPVPEEPNTGGDAPVAKEPVGTANPNHNPPTGQ